MDITHAPMFTAIEQYITNVGIEKGVTDIGMFLKYMAEKNGKTILIYFVDINAVSDNPVPPVL